MDIKKIADQVLLEAESKLRQLIADAAHQGDYSLIESLALYASTIKEMTSTNRLPKAPDKLAPLHSKQVTKKKKVSSKRKSRSKGKLRAYPKFAKSGDTLIKIGWSKSQKSEYKHKSPHIVLSKLIDSISPLFNKNAVISMDEVLPLKSEDNNDIPDYQVYLCLAWLRSIEAIEQKGREGYTRNETGADLTHVVKDAWNNLPNDK